MTTEPLLPEDAPLIEAELSRVRQVISKPVSEAMSLREDSLEPPTDVVELTEELLRSVEQPAPRGRDEARTPVEFPLMASAIFPMRASAPRPQPVAERALESPSVVVDRALTDAGPELAEALPLVAVAPSGAFLSQNLETAPVAEEARSVAAVGTHDGRQVGAMQAEVRAENITAATSETNASVTRAPGDIDRVTSPSGISARNVVGVDTGVAAREVSAQSVMSLETAMTATASDAPTQNVARLGMAMTSTASEAPAQNVVRVEPALTSTASDAPAQNVVRLETGMLSTASDAPAQNVVRLEPAMTSTASEAPDQNVMSLASTSNGMPATLEPAVWSPSSSEVAPTSTDARAQSSTGPSIQPAPLLPPTLTSLPVVGANGAPAPVAPALRMAEPNWVAAPPPSSRGWVVAAVSASVVLVLAAVGLVMRARSESRVAPPVVENTVVPTPVVSPPLKEIAVKVATARAEQSRNMLKKAQEGVTAEPQPVAAQPVAAQPVATQPVATQPVAAQPVAAQPVATQPVAAQPVATQPVAAQPVVPQPSSDARSDVSTDLKGKAVAKTDETTRKSRIRHEAVRAADEAIAMLTRGDVAATKPVKAAVGTVELKTVGLSGDVLLLDGSKVALHSPATQVEVPPGDTTLIVHAKGRVPVRLQVKVQESSPVRVDPWRAPLANATAAAAEHPWFSSAAVKGVTLHIERVESRLPYFGIPTNGCQGGEAFAIGRLTAPVDGLSPGTEVAVRVPTTQDAGGGTVKVASLRRAGLTPERMPVFCKVP